MTGRYIKVWADFGGNQFTGDEDRDGPEASVYSPFNHLTWLLAQEFYGI
jgi:hypothetical protein